LIFRAGATLGDEKPAAESGAALVRFGSVALLTALAGALLSLAIVGPWGWWIPAAVVAAIAAVGIYDLVQRKHSVLRNYPVLGHMRFLLEALRPEMQQYFVERNFDGRPFDRDVRSLIYERAKGTAAESAFGTERDIDQVGYEYLVHSATPADPPDEPFRVRIGGPDCARPYDMALLNVSAMSFGALSANALRALNNGARKGRFAHDTGEGGLTPYHLGGADVVWEIGSGYFGARTKDGAFDPDQFADKAAHDLVKCISIKLSQGAKPGIGGVLPAAKVSEEIAGYRGVPVGQKCVSPAAHSAFHTPRELIMFVARLRELAGRKPVGFKLCVGSRVDVLATCKAMLAEGVTPDFIIVDGAEGGTAAAPLEYEDNVGLPLTDGLMIVHNALVGTGLRDRSFTNGLRRQRCSTMRRSPGGRIGTSPTQTPSPLPAPDSARTRRDSWMHGSAGVRCSRSPRRVPLGRVQNSFGTGWGESGFVWIAYDSLEAMAQGRGVYVPVSA
jgi:glutamate synthase domain-containing protein 2